MLPPRRRWPHSTGTEDFIIHVVVADNESLYAFVIDELTKRREIVDVRTSVVYEHIRSRRIDPITADKRAQR
ncbi:hypothetical protein CVV68_05795 [Arthrobacter livingstonensis]|uniref:Transcription regulator AsnC/Lrp ligand binding domain-containing protein n=1 Tax=Arthrobacter livingstonensis TaxID=670078 RepID=A0A2V5M100_9MICC|nr:Lrp/AsnC ligand binding domain-containing protein [Arthrobacter livingstonensis]PYI68796.1 hypothetical protein CVV68_05795 [Arthrobacter livingstonensis]